MDTPQTPASAGDSIAFFLDLFTGFSDHALYKEIREDDGWTDADYQDAWSQLGFIGEALKPHQLTPPVPETSGPLVWIELINSELVLCWRYHQSDYIQRFPVDAIIQCIRTLDVFMAQLKGKADRGECMHDDGPPGSWAEFYRLFQAVLALRSTEYSYVP
jgi:hypothetical protein